MQQVILFVYGYRKFFKSLMKMISLEKRFSGVTQNEVSANYFDITDKNKNVSNNTSDNIPSARNFS